MNRPAARIKYLPAHLNFQLPTVVSLRHYPTNYQLPQPLTPLNSLIHKPPRLAYSPLMKAPSSSTGSLPRDSHPARLCLCASSKNEQRQSHRPHQIGPFSEVAVSLNVKPGKNDFVFPLCLCTDDSVQFVLFGGVASWAM